MRTHENPDDANAQTLINEVRKEKDDGLKQKQEEVKNSFPQRARRAIDLSREKGASSWLTVIPCKDMAFDLNKREFRDAIRLRYDWPIPNSPSVCMCGCYFSVDHAMVCQHGGLVTQRHNEIRDL